MNEDQGCLAAIGVAALSMGFGFLFNSSAIPLIMMGVGLIIISFFTKGGEK